MYFNIEIGTLD